MPGQELSERERCFYARITSRRAEVLTLALENLTEREMAAQLGVDVQGVHSHVRWLREYTGCRTLRELGPWWSAHRGRWLLAHAAFAGLQARSPRGS